MSMQNTDMNILEKFHYAHMDFMKSGGDFARIPTRVRISVCAAHDLEKLESYEIGDDELFTNIHQRGAVNVFNEENFFFRGLKVTVAETCTKEDIEADKTGDYRFDFE